MSIDMIKNSFKSFGAQIWAMKMKEGIVEKFKITIWSRHGLKIYTILKWTLLQHSYYSARLECESWVKFRKRNARFCTYSLKTTKRNYTTRFFIYYSGKISFKGRNILQPSTSSVFEFPFQIIEIVDKYIN